MTDMNKVTVELPALFHRKWQGQDFTFDLRTMDASWVARIFDYGLRVVNDEANSTLKEGLPSDKAAHIAATVTSINKGEVWEGRVRGGAASLSPVERKALAMAKEALKLAFRQATGKARIVDMCQTSDKVAKFFEGTTWKDDAVTAWMAASGQDWAAKAQAELDREKELAASLDF